ncbi:MAG: ABC-2 family transporter protein [Planctomycetes bacterium]|nr:ABC-2 family transporter protein [Planctomycetota bacterium]
MSPRLFLQVLSLEARNRLSYRAEFWLNALVGFGVEFAVVYFLWSSMFRESGKQEIGGFDLQGMVTYYLAVILLGKLVRTQRFEGGVSTDIYEGGLNRYLVFPAGYFPFKYAQHLGGLVPAVVQFLLFALVVAFFLDVPPELRPSPTSALMALAAIAVANLLYYLLDYAIQLVAFWADNVWSLDVAKWFVASLLGGFMVPLSVFPAWLVPWLEALPFRFFFDFPARVLLGQIEPAEWARGLVVALAWCGVLALVGRGVWRRGVEQYAGVGI